MSTENTQTDASPSGVSTESASVNTGSADVQSAAQAPMSDSKPSLDNLKRLAKEKEGAADTSTLNPVEESLGAAKAAPEIIPAKPTFAPNYKYKAALQEKEVDEFWRPLMKDADSEKKVIEALQKLDGFEAVKGSREELQKKYESLEGDFTEQNQIVNRVNSAIQKKDLSSVFRQIGLTDQDIFNWTHNKLQMMELPEPQRRAMEEAENSRLQNFEWEEKMSQMQKMYETQAVQARTMQLDFVLSRPEVSSSAQSWDTLNGQTGAFKNLVIQEAQTAYYQENLDLTPEQAVQRVMQKFGKVMSQGGSQAQAPQMQQASAPVVQAPQAKPVIPNINGKGTAPIKKVPKNLDDLRKIAKSLTN